MRFATYEPSFNSFFPRTARGHGSAHATHTKDGSPNPKWQCVAESCATHRQHQGHSKKELHQNKKKNIEDWKGERGLK